MENLDDEVEIFYKGLSFLGRIKGETEDGKSWIVEHSYNKGMTNTWNKSRCELTGLTYNPNK